ncbi:MAG: hypothetical protein L0H59_05590, partial [Tomitella sp.]|nr:hypothetical protein [Tomitella sp.]
RSAAAVHGVKYLDQRRRREQPGVRQTRSYRYREHDWDEYEYFDPEPPVLIRPRSASNRPCPGLFTRNIELAGRETVMVRGMGATSPARTGFDLSRWPASARQGWDSGSPADFERRLIVLDALCNATKVLPCEIADIAMAHPQAAGARRARDVLPLVDGGSDSPQETRLRLLLIRRGYPRPRTQFPVTNEYGQLHAHVDLAWPQWRAGLEYDGDWHRRSEEKKTSDIARYEGYRRLGWDVVRVDKHLLNTMQAMLLGFVDDQLARVGATW